mmetsp:Transcript_14970/g.32469  ORF Transcript_14970/g.32469 Transcript_14970/m.32469 type:complete len:83 (-) Transcript_14970:86-334(-)
MAKPTSQDAEKSCTSAGANFVQGRPVKKTLPTIKLANAKTQPRSDGDRDLYGRLSVGQRTASRGGTGGQQYLRRRLANVKGC